VALVDRRDAAHTACAEIAARSTGPLITTWACFTEAMWIAGSRVGWTAQEPLWKLVQTNRLVLMDLDGDGRERAHSLMTRYRETPMALADATLVVTAERMSIDTVFTLDGDFNVYRLNDRKPINVVP